MYQKVILAALTMAVLSWACDSKNSNEPKAGPSTVVELMGPLKVSGNQITGKAGEPVVLRGMSLFWSQWAGRFYNADCIRWLHEDWHCTVVRAALGISPDGYPANAAEELNKINTVVEACIDLGIYVIIDWHSHGAENETAEAMAFFKLMAQRYGAYDNVIYEIYNEPVNSDWDTVIRPYAEAVIGEIRSEDPDNLILVGTKTWSQDVDDASLNPLDDANTAYVMHFYAGTHTQWLRDKTATALNRGAAVFVSEWGVSLADATGGIFSEETGRWISFMDAHNLSWCNWSVCDKVETTSIVKASAASTGGWSDEDLTETGRYVRQLIRSGNEAVFDQISESE